MDNSTTTAWSGSTLSADKLMELVETIKPVVRARIVVSKHAAPQCNVKLPTHYEGRRISDVEIFLLGTETYKALLEKAPLMESDGVAMFTGIPITFEPQGWRP
jgi:hypothetical protein